MSKYSHTVGQVYKKPAEPQVEMSNLEFLSEVFFSASAMIGLIALCYGILLIGGTQ
jgi:hypothetical protein